MFDSSLCADEKLKQRKLVAIDPQTHFFFFCKYFIPQFIDIWSCFTLLVQRVNELNSGNGRSAFQRQWQELTKVTHIWELISLLLKCLECFLLPIREKLLSQSHNLKLHSLQEANNKFINHNLVPMSVLV